MRPQRSASRLIAALSLALAALSSRTAHADPQEAEHAEGADTGATTTAEGAPARSEPENVEPREPEILYELQRPPRPSPALPAHAAPSLDVPWMRHLEVGGSVAFGVRPVDPVGPDRGIRYKPAIGFGLHATIPIVSWLFFTAYFVDLRHEVGIPNGALGSLGRTELDSLKTYAFGARLSPTLQWTPRLRTWITGGAGWGRMEFGRMTLRETAGDLLVGERASPFVEFPIGLGVAFEVLPRWFILHYEVTGAFISDQGGDAVQSMQGIDALGHLRQVGPLPRFGSSWVQTLGLSIVL